MNRRTTTFRINFPRHFQPIRICQISICSSDGEDHSVWFGNVLHEHVTDLFLDIPGLVTNRDLRLLG